jgi:hypothetical protein
MTETTRRARTITMVGDTASTPPDLVTTPLGHQAAPAIPEAIPAAPLPPLGTPFRGLYGGIDRILAEAAVTTPGPSRLPATGVPRLGLAALTHHAEPITPTRVRPHPQPIPTQADHPSDSGRDPLPG